MITRDKTSTPVPVPEGYDWTNEPWVNDAKVRAISYYIAGHVIAAFAATGDNPQDEEDERVCAFLNPALTERVCKGPYHGEIIDPRLLTAAAQGIDELITVWMKKLGSIDSPGMPQRPVELGN